LGILVTQRGQEGHNGACIVEFAQRLSRSGLDFLIAVLEERVAGLTTASQGISRIERRWISTNSKSPQNRRHADSSASSTAEKISFIPARVTHGWGS
jgi:hypothetical protein